MVTNDKRGEFIINLTPNNKGFFVKLSNPLSALNFSKSLDVKKIFSKEKAKILFTLKKFKPSSIYELAKILNRDFSAVYNDLKILQSFDIVSFEKKKIGNKESLIPVLNCDNINIVIKLR